jgi:hypothetical protein
MRFFASWWEKIPVRQATQTLMAVAVGAGAFGFVSDFLKSILGHSWT